MVILLFNFTDDPIFLNSRSADYIQAYFSKYALDGWSLKYLEGVPEYGDESQVIHLNRDDWYQFKLIKHLDAEAVYKYFNAPSENLQENF